ncbi:MAG: LysR family transcriptional regulator [Acetobacteraceae bacterium]
MTPQRLRKLQAFHLVMQTGSVTQAAEALSVSQPAVSKLLQALESETRLTLFDRTRRRLLPTLDARRFHVEVERLFRTAAGIDHLANEIRSAGGPPPGSTISPTKSARQGWESCGSRLCPCSACGRCRSGWPRSPARAPGCRHR